MALALPPDVQKVSNEGSVKLFGKWDSQESVSPVPSLYTCLKWPGTDGRFSIDVKDISLTDYINVNHAVYVRTSFFFLGQGKSAERILV